MSNLEVAIIVNQDNKHNEHKIKRFYEEANKLNLDLKVYVNDGSLSKIVDGQVQIKFTCDYAIYLDKDIYLAKLLEQAGYIVFPQSHFLKLCDDKLYTYIALSNHHISMPLTISSPLVFTNELKEKHLNFIDHVINTIGLPLVAKKVYGSLGLGVYLISSKEELLNLYKENYRLPMLFQSYISSSYGKSIRVLIIDGKIFGAFERYNPYDFRSNYGSTATSKSIQLNEKYNEFVEKIVQILDISYAGIDLLYGENNEPILCEINSNAFFEEFEKVTKKNAAYAYLEMTKKLYIAKKEENNEKN